MVDIIELATEILMAVKPIAEKHVLHVERDGEAVAILTNALARAALALALASDREVTAVQAKRVHGGMAVSVRTEGQWLSCEPGTYKPKPGLH